MTQINNNEPKIQSDSYTKQSGDLSIDPATGLPIDPATGVPIDPTTGLPFSKDSISSFSDSSLSMYDLLDSSNINMLRPDLPQIAGALTYRGILKEAVLKGKTRKNLEEDISRKNIKNAQITQTTIPTTSTSQEIVGNQGLEETGTKATGNPWIQNPNSIASMMIVSMSIAKMLSQSKLSDGKMKILLNMTIFKLGMEAADDAKALRDLQANQETMKAMNSFVSAGLAVYQMASIVNQRGKDEQEAEKNNGANAQKKKVEEAQTAYDGIIKNAQSATETGKTLSAEEAAQTPQAKEAKKTLDTEQEKLTKAQAAQKSEMYEISRYNSQINEAKFKAINSFVDGAFTLAGTIITKEIGVKEQHKMQLEAMQSACRSFVDGIGEAIKDADSFMEKTLSIAERTSADTSARLAIKG